MGGVVHHPKEGRKVETDPNNPADAEQAIRAIEAPGPAIAPPQTPGLEKIQQWLMGAETAATTKPPGRKLDVIVKEYLRLNAHKWKPDTRADYSAALVLFTDKMGNRPITEITRQDIHRMINLTLLPPWTVAAILDDALPNHITLFDLAVDPPALWDEQRERVGL